VKSTQKIRQKKRPTKIFKKKKGILHGEEIFALA
jgi:hypothetical protein